MSRAGLLHGLERDVDELWSGIDPRRNLERAAGVDPMRTLIVLHEPPLENWGIRGGKAATDVQIGFKVDV